MPDRMRKSKKAGGPYLAAAFFCENVIEDKADGALSAIRIIDQIKIGLRDSPDFPTEENRLPVSISGLLSFKTGHSKEKEHVVRVTMISPTGKVNVPFEQTLRFTAPEHGGSNLTLRTTIMVVNGGLFWFKVYLDDKLIAHMPLLITVQKMAPAEFQAALAESSPVPLSAGN